MIDFSRLRRFSARTSYEFKNWFRSHRRQLFLKIRDGGLARNVEEYRRLVEARDWQAALPKALDLAAVAQARNDRLLLSELSQGLVRMGAYCRAAELKLACRHLEKGRRPGEWGGEDISDKTLLIDLMETEKQGLATAIRHAGAIGRAADRARRCIVLVEHRLVPLFQRTFPDVDVRAVGSAAGKAAYAEADAFAGVQHLTAFLETDEATIARNFVALRPDPVVTTELRTAYRRDDRPIVGISWGSSNFGKDLPPLSIWPPLLDSRDAQFVSLQYGRIEAELDVLRAEDAGRIIHDTSVDQLVDMDRFAAQISALDAVVTISNTGAHLAGALGAPSVFILGDRFKRFWPVDANRTPYYPSAVLVWKQRRDWEAVMDEARSHLRSLLGYA